MPKSRAQKQKLIRILQILNEKTDDDSGITTSELIEALARFGISAERKSIYDDIETLRDLGYDIVAQKEGKAVKYALVSRKFELAELKLLADAVSSSKFITEKKSDSLISKIATLTSQANAKGLRRQVFVRNRVKTRNEKIYYNIDTLHRAIAAGHQVMFRYYEYTTEKDENNQPKRRFKGGIKDRTASPYAMIWDDENYYLIAYYEKYGHLVNFRVDKMDGIQVLEAKNTPVNVNIPEYAKKTFGMFPGEETNVTLIVDNACLDIIYDRFGKDIPVTQFDNDHFVTHVNVAVSPPFFGWLFQFNGKIAVAEPQSLKTEIVRYAKLLIKQYK